MLVFYKRPHLNLNPVYSCAGLVVCFFVVFYGVFFSSHVWNVELFYVCVIVNFSFFLPVRLIRTSYTTHIHFRIRWSKLINLFSPFCELLHGTYRNTSLKPFLLGFSIYLKFEILLYECHPLYTICTMGWVENSMGCWNFTYDNLFVQTVIINYILFMSLRNRT